MTRRRAAVVQTLADRAGFVSVQELHAWMGEAGIRVGLTTVYRALHGPERECGAPQRRARAASLTVENRRLSLPCRSDEMSSAADPVIAGGEAEAQRSSGRRTTALLARWLEDFCGRFGRRESGSRTGVLRLAGSDDRDEVLTRLVPPCPLTERETRSVMTGYSRELFPHWITVSGTCNTRETVLKRDGTHVVAGSDCSPDSGSWYSPYDGITEYVASDIDIDHVVPLAEAWRSGADSWTTSKREDFANDLDYPQLIAVTDNVNQSKGDKDPAAWKPPLSSYYRTYSKMWIRSKYHWGLTVQSSEKSALQNMLLSCSS